MARVAERARDYRRGMRTLPSPYDAIAAGHPASIELHGTSLLGERLLNKDLAFSQDERLSFGVSGLLPAQMMTIDQQVDLELEHLRRKPDDLERYIGLAALQDRNATLFYRVLATNLEEFLPVVYTPTVGRACQQYSHILRRTRGLWITPDDQERIPEILRHSPYRDVRLIVVTDNERILGLGDQGAGGMGIPIGKLALYTAACGLHPSVTLPVSLDVGTDNAALLEDPLYVGYRAPRLRGPAYDALVRAFVHGVREVWPGCVIQWEDFKHYNALRILDRYREVVPSFNDDIQGTAAVVVGGLLAGLRHQGAALAEQRIVLDGAGAAGIGIARLLRVAMLEAGADAATPTRDIVLVDSQGMVHEDRVDLDPTKRDFARPRELLLEAGLFPGGPIDLLETVRAVRPTILIGTTSTKGAFTEPVIRAMAETAPRPIVMPLSNPTSATEADPADILAWTEGRALIATGSPFAPIEYEGRRHEFGQGNNVFIFPGIGLGTVVAEVRTIPDTLFLAAAHALAGLVSAERFATGALYPSVADLRSVAREVAIAVVREAVRRELTDLPPDVDIAAEVDRAMWWPDYVSYLDARDSMRRRAADRIAPSEDPELATLLAGARSS
jgi:malate dehydrogenase (oxaloacetate-decarboxylating)